MIEEKIPFNVPHLTGKETSFINDAVAQRVLSGNGFYTKRCQSILSEQVGSEKILLTTSCTDALEMSALLLNIQDGDEVIMPSYTFVSTANAFVLRGAHIRFVDSRPDHPGMDESLIEELITPRTKAIVVVHYAGVACDMDLIKEMADRHQIAVVEDAAQAIDSYYKGRHLGSIGDLAAFSFHETKNIISGEGGCLAVNNQQYVQRSEIIWEKGTNRAAFWRGEVDKYGWVDIGSSFLASDLTAAFLYAQLKHQEQIQKKRKKIWRTYNDEFVKHDFEGVQLPFIPEYASNNAHMYYLVFKEMDQRSAFIRYLKERNIHALFHYQSLHRSPYYEHKHDGRRLPNCDRYHAGLVRLPLFFDLTQGQIERVIEAVTSYFKMS